MSPGIKHNDFWTHTDRNFICSLKGIQFSRDLKASSVVVIYDPELICWHLTLITSAKTGGLCTGKDESSVPSLDAISRNDLRLPSRVARHAAGVKPAL
jgi:hypothetical protein